MSRNKRILLVVAVVISLAATGVVYAGMNHGRRGPFGDQLTEEQREAIHTRVQEMRQAGASREEVHDAIRGMLEGYGVTAPECPPERAREGRGPGGRFGDQLTEEQREAIHTRVREMRQAGASREEIRATVHEMLTGFGIEPPDCPEGGGASSRTGILGDGSRQDRRWGEIKGRFE